MDGFEPIQPGEELRYFYLVFSYLGPHGTQSGAATLKQKKQKSGDPDNGLNIAVATRWLLESQKTLCIITAWKEISEQRYREWQGFCQSLLGVAPPRPSLGVVQGGNEKGSEPAQAPILKLIPIPTIGPKTDPSP